MTSQTEKSHSYNPKTDDLFTEKGCLFFSKKLDFSFSLCYTNIGMYLVAHTQENS